MKDLEVLRSFCTVRIIYLDYWLNCSVIDGQIQKIRALYEVKLLISITCNWISNYKEEILLNKIVELNILCAVANRTQFVKQLDYLVELYDFSSKVCCGKKYKFWPTISISWYFSTYSTIYSHDMYLSYVLIRKEHSQR